jgi:hypothetical protein
MPNKRSPSRSPAYAAALVGASFALALLAACGGGGDDGGEPTEAPQATEQATETPQPEDGETPQAAVDACSLLTDVEVEAELGVPVQAVAQEARSLGDSSPILQGYVESGCDYQSEDPPFVLLSVVQREAGTDPHEQGPQTIEEYCEALVAPEGGLTATPVPGIGDAAYDSEALGLVVLAGDYCLTLLANSPLTGEEGDAAEREIQQSLGATAAGRLP